MHKYIYVLCFLILTIFLGSPFVIADSASGLDSSLAGDPEPTSDTSTPAETADQIIEQATSDPGAASQIFNTLPAEQQGQVLQELTNRGAEVDGLTVSSDITISYGGREYMYSSGSQISVTSNGPVVSQGNLQTQGRTYYDVSNAGQTTATQATTAADQAATVANAAQQVSNTGYYTITGKPGYYSAAQLAQLQAASKNTAGITSQSKTEVLPYDTPTSSSQQPAKPLGQYVQLDDWGQGLKNPPISSETITPNFENGITAASAGSATIGTTTISGATNLYSGQDAIFAGSANEILFRNTRFRAVGDFYAIGNTVYLGAGDLVISGENQSSNYFFNLQNSIFQFDENGKLVYASIQSAEDNNQFLIGRNLIIADRGQGFEVYYTEDGMYLQSADKISFQSLETNEEVQINGSLTAIAYDYQLGITCTTLGKTSKYKYNGSITRYDPFAVYCPSSAAYFSLCIIKDEKQKFAAKEEQQGVIDLVEHNATLLGIYEFEKLREFPKMFTDIIEAKRCNASLEFDEKLETGELEHKTLFAEFHSGPFSILYNQSFGYYQYYFYDYTKPYALEKIGDNIFIDKEEKTLTRELDENMVILYWGDGWGIVEASASRSKHGRDSWLRSPAHSTNSSRPVPKGNQGTA